MIVSITSHASDVARLPASALTRGVLRLAFVDAIVPPAPGVPVFTEADARAIWALLDASPDAERLVVHCDAGISRSPAVAAAVLRARGESDAEWFARARPNELVYRTMLAVREAPRER